MVLFDDAKMTFLKFRIADLFLWILFLCGLGGIISFRDYNIFPVTEILEIFFLFSCCLLCRNTSRHLLLILFLTITYLLFNLFHALAFNVNALDFLLAYKSFAYLTLLVFFVNKDIFEKRDVVRIFKFLLIFFFVKYFSHFILFNDEGFSRRPGLFGENNYELIFLLFLFFLARDAIGKWSAIYFLLLMAIVIISGSRSASLAFVLSLALAIDWRGVKSSFVSLFLLVLVSSFVLALYISRMGDGIESVDRFQFLLLFLEETKSWSWQTYLWGNHPLTPLSIASCRQLSFYESLFSLSGDGSCYSVILHSFILRVIFDHGLLGFAFLLCSVWYCLKLAKYKTQDQLSLMSILLVSGLSISSFNSIYATLSLAVAFSYKRTQ